MIQPAFVQADTTVGFPSAYLRLARPKQWTKNGFVLAGVIFAGEAVELIDAVVPAAELVRRIGAEAEAQLRRGAALLA